MADQTMTVNQQKITVPADTDDHTLSVSKFGSGATILIDNISWPIRFGVNVITNATLSAVYTTTDKVLLSLSHPSLPSTLHFRGAAGSETFQITVLNQ